MVATVSNEIKKLVWANPDMKPAEIVKILAEAGLTTSERSVSSYRSDFLNTVAVLKELNAFNGAEIPQPTPKPKKSPVLSRVDRWNNACSDARNAIDELQQLQSEYQEWLESLPENFSDSVVQEKLESVTSLYFDSAINCIDEAEGVDLPLGFGRD